MIDYVCLSSLILSCIRYNLFEVFSLRVEKKEADAKESVFNLNDC